MRKYLKTGHATSSNTDCIAVLPLERRRVRRNGPPIRGWIAIQYPSPCCPRTYSPVESSMRTSASVVHLERHLLFTLSFSWNSVQNIWRLTELSVELVLLRVGSNCRPSLSESCEDLVSKGSIFNIVAAWRARTTRGQSQLVQSAPVFTF